VEKRYFISLSRVELNGNRTINIQPVIKIAELDQNTFLSFSAVLPYFDPHQPNTIQTTHEDGSLSLSLIPPLKDIRSIHEIAESKEDDLKTLIKQFAEHCTQAHEREHNLMLCVQVRFESSTQEG
jgi:hypothetical protein